ncbi:MAG TPA: hypothetical protein VI248_02190, partial [Kineosporiaceae bacterium]
GGKDGPKPSLRAATAVAIREAEPETVPRIVAQLAVIGTMDAPGAAWRHRVALAPIAATAMVPIAAALEAGPTAVGLTVTGVAGLIAGQAEHPSQRRRRGLAWWSGGALTWMGANAIGATGSLVWWQDMAVLAAAAAPGAIAWWRRPDPVDGTVLDPQPQAAPELAWIPPAVLLLGRVLEQVCRMEKSPILGATVERVIGPAEGVAAAVVALPGGMHADQLDMAPFRCRRGWRRCWTAPASGSSGTCSGARCRSSRPTLSWA